MFIEASVLHSTVDVLVNGRNRHCRFDNDKSSFFQNKKHFFPARKMGEIPEEDEGTDSQHEAAEKEKMIPVEKKPIPK